MEYENAVAVPQRALKELISGTIFSVSENQARPIHTGCLFEVGGRDHHRGGCGRLPAGPASAIAFEDASRSRTMKFVVPGGGLKGGGEDPRRHRRGGPNSPWAPSTSSLRSETPRWCAVCWKENSWTGAGWCPPTTPSSWRPTSSQLTSLHRAGGPDRVREAQKPGALHLWPGLGGFPAPSPPSARPTTCAPWPETGKDLEIGFNCRYLLEALRAVPTPGGDAGAIQRPEPHRPDASPTSGEQVQPIWSCRCG